MCAAPEKLSSPPTSAAPRRALERATEFDVRIRCCSRSGQFTINQLPKAAPVFKLKRVNWSWRRLHYLSDLNGVALYRMEQPRVLSCRNTTHIVDEQSGRVVWVLRRHKWYPGWGGNTILAWRGDSEQGQVSLRVDANCLRRQFTVVEHATNQVLADARREKMGRKFVLRVEAGNDAAFMLFFAIVADVIYQDVNRRCW